MDAPATLPAAALLDELDKLLARHMEIEDMGAAERDAHALEHDALVERTEASVVMLSHATPQSEAEKRAYVLLTNAQVGRLRDDDLEAHEREATLALVQRLLRRVIESQAGDDGSASRWSHFAAYFDNE